ncbi:transglycosylase SLT domain-containing protein [Thioclava sp. 15-R06ZXC-3]|uniref:Transglycosylase SLT domain-containing protein n=1 Tax=Thioclava arctica TaxID=3238301 RepID=A0ABV3TK75_9RHOB
MLGTLRLLSLSALLCLGNGHALRASTLDLAAICEAAAEQVSRESGVPVSVLKAISLNETGRKRNGAFRPWPWTVNMEGAGHWFETRDAALAYVFKEFKRGARSFDVGCFQINYKWHGEHFSSIEEMFDPLANGRYAAQFLSDLYSEMGDWKKAAGAFHSRTKKYADSYSTRFSSIRKKFLHEDGAPSDPADLVGAQRSAKPLDTRNSQIPDIPDIVLAQQENRRQQTRENTYPLLIRKETGAPSLGRAAGASLFANALAKREGL